MTKPYLQIRSYTTINQIILIDKTKKIRHSHPKHSQYTANPHEKNKKIYRTVIEIKRLENEKDCNCPNNTI